jgi:hypothetical protein
MTARRLGYVLQLAGAGFLIVVLLTHVAEALHLFPGMGWACRIVLGTTSISLVPSLARSYFLRDICPEGLQTEALSPPRAGANKKRTELGLRPSLSRGRNEMTTS